MRFRKPYIRIGKRRRRYGVPTVRKRAIKRMVAAPSRQYYTPAAFDSGFMCDAVKPTGDPTGTFDLRRRYGSDAELRFRKVRMLLRKAVVDQDMLGLKAGSISPIAMAGGAGNKEQAFQTWFDALLKRLVIENDGLWLRPAMQTSYARAVKRGMRLTKKNAVPEDQQGTIDTLARLCTVELQGIVEAVSQRVVRGVSLAILHHSTPAEAFRDMDTALSAVGITRSKAMIELMVVKAFSTGTLDQFEAAGVKKVGLVPETVPGTSRARDAEWSEELHPRGEGGRFGAGGLGEKAKASVSKFVKSDKAQKVIAGVVGKIKDKENQKELLASAVTFAMYHFMGLDFGADIEHAVHHEVAHFADNAKIAFGLARERVRDTVDGLIKLRRGTKDAIDDAKDPILAALEGLAKILAKDELFATDAPPRGTGPGSRIGREEAPSRRTVQRIRAAQKGVEALGKVNVETAGDDDVCPVCQDIEDENPYTIDEARSLIPAHPRCRCAFVPAE
jgi:hypothetical protein